jgi:uncharacterized membrane protein
MVDNDNMPDSLNYHNMARWTVWLIVLVAVIVLSTVFGVYWGHFHNLPVSYDPDKWGVFGDFIGGTANPILSFLTIVLLAVTLLLQTRQLSISSNELELSRKELELTRAECSGLIKTDTLIG